LTRVKEGRKINSINGAGKGTRIFAEGRGLRSENINKNIIFGESLGGNKNQKLSIWYKGGTLSKKKGPNAGADLRKECPT